MVNKDAVEELKAQLEDHDNLIILLQNSDDVELEVTDVKFEDGVIKVTTTRVDSDVPVRW